MGSSHITRLNNFISKYDMNLKNHTIRIQGVNGGMVNSLYRYLTEVHEFRPDMVLLQIGSNDIGSKDQTVYNVLFAIQQFVDILLSLIVQHVIVGMLFNRHWVLPRRGLSLRQYNDKVYELNCRLYMLQSSYRNKMTFWIHRGLQFQIVNILDKYGVHLNEEGNRRLMSSIRGALLFGETLLMVI